MRLHAKEPKWLTLIEPVPGDKEAPRGVRVKCAHVGRSIKRKAARASQKALAGIDLSDRERELSDADVDALYEAGDVSSRELIRLAILDQGTPEWDGVLDAKGKPLPVTAEAVELALDDEDFFEAADRLIVMPAAERDREKNALSASPSGIGEAGTPARDTASSAAGKKTAAAAKPAPTRSKSSKRPKAK